jgi:hypothetical protein
MPQSSAAGIGADDRGRAPTNWFEIQLALAVRGFRSGAMDGLDGPQTRGALRAFQEDQGLPVTGQPDAVVLGRLRLMESTIREHRVTRGDLDALGPVPTTWEGKSRVARLPHESLLEAMAERSASHPGLVRRLNPGLDWAGALPGVSIWLPGFKDPPTRPAARVKINLQGRTLRATDAAGRILLHAPCSIGRVASARPRGRLHVVRIVNLPTYRFDPARFPESEEARATTQKRVLPPGPDNPVGIAWLELDLPGHGIHGTPWPEKVGRSESHGCFRLANWDVAYLARIARAGLEVEIGDED